MEGLLSTGPTPSSCYGIPKEIQWLRYTGLWTICELPRPFLLTLFLKTYSHFKLWVLKKEEIVKWWSEHRGGLLPTGLPSLVHLQRG